MPSPVVSRHAVLNATWSKFDEIWKYPTTRPARTSYVLPSTRTRTA